MKMKKIFAAMAAAAISTSAFAAMSLSASAVEQSLSYTESAGTLNVDNDGVSLRRNIINPYQDAEDLDPNTTVSDHITIDFTVSGIGDASALEDGTPFKAWIAGSIGANPQVWTMADAGDNTVAITGDGDYSVTWPLAEGSETIEIFFLQTNINMYAFGDGLDKTTANLTINSIKTDDGKEAPTEAPTEAPKDGEATTTTEAPKDDKNAETTTTTTTKAADKDSKSDSKSQSDSKSEASAQTGDHGVGVALAAIAVAGAAAFVARKKD